MPMPKPVSASPPSWRTPISRDGSIDSNPVHVPSRPDWSRATSVSAAARLPPLPRTSADLVRTTIACDFAASSSPPSAGAFIRTPRRPAAAIARSMSVAIGSLSFGVTTSSPAP